MRIAIISDIHGNYVALEAVLDDLKSKHIDHIVCLGDVATDGPQPREVIAQLRNLDCPVVMGNMDSWILNPPPKRKKVKPIREIQYWGIDQLSLDDLDFLRTFRATVEITLNETTSLLCYHGSPVSNEKGIGSTTSDEDLDLLLSGHRATVLAGGHTHRQMLRHYGDTTILNPGTVGAPMPQANQECPPIWAEYAIVDSGDNTFRVELCRVPLDVNALIKSARDSDMPHADWWLALRYGRSALQKPSADQNHQELS